MTLFLVWSFLVICLLIFIKILSKGYVMSETTSKTTNDIEVINSQLPDAPTGSLDNMSADASSAQAYQKIHLQDYQAPAFNIAQADLTIQVYDQHTLVSSHLHIQKQDADYQGGLTLDGVGLELIDIAIDGQTLPKERYHTDATSLMITDVPDDFSLFTRVKIDPNHNTALEGLYRAGEGDDTMYVTQCEPEGFRKITYFIDRPDVLCEYTTRIEADKRYPTLLANGNLIEAGEISDANSGNAGNRHYAVWHDPTKKPSYLFACVIADLAVLEDNHITSEGRDVLLQIYAKPKDISKCDVAMTALKDAMRWDEVNYGRAYDLDRYMIVAVSQFNMGAMENKGLNIFNTACVLSEPATTTDARSFRVKAIIAHEYFHNWTGNRITCRDWFQLCLKEGLTVYRDQSFSADQQSASVQRIEDVAILRTSQFAEDASPLAHPVRPESFIEINNFYTATVYEKGAEIVRMLANLLGEQKYRAGMNEYFKRYDGQAVTVEDFLSALATQDVHVLDFMPWYRQAGTPNVHIEQDFNPTTAQLNLSIKQHTRAVTGHPKPVALPIPMDMAVFDRQTGNLVFEQTLLITQDNQTFELDLSTVSPTADKMLDPVLSVFRNFSAPVTVDFAQSTDDLLFLIANETNGYNRWQAGQGVVNRLLRHGNDDGIHGGGNVVDALRDEHQRYFATLNQVLAELTQSDPMLASYMLDVPNENELATGLSHDYDPMLIKNKRDAFIKNMATALQDTLITAYQHSQAESYVDSPNARGKRALRNVCLYLLGFIEQKQAMAFATQQYADAHCMTERQGALQTLINMNNAQTQLSHFYRTFSDEPLAVDLWFAVQAGKHDVSVAEIQALMHHEQFDWHTPNRVRAVLTNFANRPVAFWSTDGIELYCQAIGKLDDINPVLASRLLQSVSHWHTLINSKQINVKARLLELKTNIHSKNVSESLDAILSVE